MLVTDRRMALDGRLTRVVAEAVAGGVNMVQLREKDLPAAELFELGMMLKHAVAGRALLIINDRADVALALEADGVQLPENGLSVGAARKVLGPDKLIGRSVHSEEGAKVAAAHGAHYLVLGTIFESSSHPGEPPLGLDQLGYLITGIPLVSAEPAEIEGLREDIRETWPVPVLPIGGITAANAAQVMSTGAAGVAVMSAIMRSGDPRAAAQALRAAIGG
jgi:thiamine-phosphate pyrophosphorylase